MPDAGHLQHMPTHIDVLCGDYQRVIADNEKAIAADDRYAEHAGRLNFYSLYRAHDHHFRIYGAMFAGNRRVALDGGRRARGGAARRSCCGSRLPPMADWLEGFVPMSVHVLVRFGMWDELIALEPPEDAELYAHDDGDDPLRAGRRAGGDAGAWRTPRPSASGSRPRSRAVPETRYLFNNTCADILAVAERDARRRDRLPPRRVTSRRSRSCGGRSSSTTALPYDEPWGWMQPTRHAYGALLLEQGEVELAEAVYAADLGLDDTLGRACQHPNNVWSLHGYHECLDRLGKAGRGADRRAAARPREGARADVEIHASCFCRLQA